MIIRLSFSFLLVFLTPSVISFSALPYVHIDFGHFFRLAQCQAKCTEKFGELTSRTLLDGTERRFFNVSNDEYLSCDRGCAHGRLLTKKHTRSPMETAYKDGQAFWLQSETDNGSNGQGPIEAVDILCLQPSGETTNGFLDSLTARLGTKLKSDFLAPARFIVQWKQMSVLEGGQRLDTKWITGSVEKSPVLEVEQLQPGVFYRFQVTAVGPQGRLGKGVLSDWLQVPAAGESSFEPSSPLNVRSGFNGDDGLSALLTWPSIVSSSHHSLRTPMVDSGFQQVPQPTACRFHIILEGKNGSTVVNNIFDKDESSGILLKDLDYSTEYRMKLRTMFSDDGASPGGLETTFRSLSCPEVHGRGSLECDPEPVENLTVRLQGNSKALVFWDHAVDPVNVLIYQLTYSSVDEECGDFQGSVYVNPIKTNTTISLPLMKECEFEVELTAFDAFGREAMASTSFRLTTSPQTLPALWVILGPGAVLLILCSILHCARCCCRRGSRKKVGELAKKQGPENV